MRKILFFAAGLLLSVSALHAQVISAYGTFSIPHVSGVRNGGAAPDYSTGSFWAPGVGGGVTLGVIPVGPVRLGFDLRASTRPGTPGVDTVLSGIRIGLRVPLVKLKPYIQASGGYLGTRTSIISGVPAGSTETDKFVGYEILGGVDVPLAPFFDLRAIEVGGGQGFNLIGIGDTYGNYKINVFTLNSGIVFHF